MVRTLVVAVLIYFAAWAAMSQEGHIGHGHEAWHADFYNRLMKPDMLGYCCNMTDCRPTSGRMTDGKYEVKVNGQWVEVLQSKIVKKTAPDGGYHVCAPYNWNGAPDGLYCVVLPPEG